MNTTEHDGEGSWPRADRRDDQSDDRPARRSPVLALFGLAALLVAGWGLADGPSLPSAATVGWVVVGVGLLAGLLLILTGARSRR